MPQQWWTQPATPKASEPSAWWMDQGEPVELPDMAPVASHAPDPVQASRDRYRAANEKEGRLVRRILPVAASLGAGLMTGGASIPAQMAIQGGIGALGQGGIAALEGGTADDAKMEALKGGLGGLLGGGVGGKLGQMGRAAKIMATPTKEISEVPSAILDAGGKPFMNTVSRTIPPDLSKAKGAIDAMSGAVGMVSPRLGFASKMIGGGVGASPSILSSLGSGLKSFQPGLPASLQALLALLNKR